MVKIPLGERLMAVETQITDMKETLKGHFKQDGVDHKEIMDELKSMRETFSTKLDKKEFENYKKETRTWVRYIPTVGIPTLMLMFTVLIWIKSNTP